MRQSEYEVISHNDGRFNLFLVSLLYRTPHIHREYEVSLVVEGTVQLTVPGASMELSEGDIFLMNPFLSHELKAESPVLILSLQIPPAFFSSYYPQMERTEFDSLTFSDAAVRHQLLRLADTYFRQEAYSPLECAVGINQIFLSLLRTQFHHITPERERQNALTRGTRMRKILTYIEEHYTEKILLSDIARQEGLDLYYLSHYFKECFGMSFQGYVLKLRCERARQLLLTADMSLLDIGISCGFSDPKYFNKGFRDQYGCTPKAYRAGFRSARPEQREKSILTAQEFLSATASLEVLTQLEL